ncbi:MAG: M23 family metallopeptidase [Bryobacterales bacterium]|nr:M23 family metallopeptidase [Bryobacterales bacterium]
MKQPYFVVVLAHSLHGRLRRIDIPQKAVVVVLLLAVFGCFSVFGFVSSYVRMVGKVAGYNSLRREAEALRTRYNNLQKEVSQTKQDMATLQSLASEVSNAFGLRRQLEGPPDISSESSLVPTLGETLEEYNFLKSANLTTFRNSHPRLLQVNTRPTLWPVEGRLIGPFGRRSDPLSGQMAFHTGVDISGTIGTPIRAAADGVVALAEFAARYGRLVVIDHGGGLRTYYAHLSRFEVIAGQEVRRGQIIGALGASGRVSGPHLHYEVRQNGFPVNPYSTLARSPVARATRPDLPF